MKHLLKIAIGTIFIILFMIGSATAQLNNHMILRKGPRSIMNFMAGDSIRLLKNDFKTPEGEQIQGIGVDFIVIKDKPLPISDISGIVHIRALHFRAAGTANKIAGPGLIFIDGFNSLIRGFRPLWSKNIVIAGTIIFVTGFILPTFQSKVYYRKKGYYLIIVPSDPETYRNLR